MTKKIMACLLSNQHIPNLIGVKMYTPDKLILVVSKKMKDKSDLFLNALKIGGLNYEDKKEIIELDDEFNLQKVMESAQSILNKYSANQIYFNISGGTKIMTLGFYSILKDKFKLIYIPENRNDTFIFINDGKEESFNKSVSVSEFLMGYGFQGAKSEKTISDEKGRAKTYFECALQLAKNAESDDLLCFDREDDENHREKHENFRKSGGELREEYWTSFAHNNMENALKPWLAGNNQLDKYKAKFLTGGWLEVFAYGLLCKFEVALKINDINLGFEVKRKDEIQPGNDLDVCFINNLTLHIIECKSGSQASDEKADIVYKLEAIRSQLGALNSKNILLTTGTNIYKRGTTEIKDSLKTKLKNFNASIIDCAKIKKLAIAYENNDSDTIKNIFFNIKTD